MRQLFCDARQHGLANGVTFSVLGKQQEPGILGLAMERNRQRDKHNIRRHLGLGYMRMVHMHEAMRRLQFPRTAGAATRRLTQRESETLLWGNVGKTSWEVACAELDVGTRRHAAAKELALGGICP